MHEDVAAEDEGVAIDLGDDAAARGTDMSEKAVRLGVSAEVSEVEIAVGRGLRFVKSRALALDLADVVLSRFGVPGYAETLHVEKTVAHLEERIFGIVQLFLFAVGKELGEVMLRALLGDGIGGVNKNIRQETRLLGGNVGEPAAHRGRMLL